MIPSQSEFTQILVRFGKGEPQAVEELLPIVYQELRKLAGGFMRKEQKNHTLQPTALVHEAYFKLVGQNEVEWQNRAHFFGVAANVMRRILIDHARGKQADKRGGDMPKVSFDEAIHLKDEADTDILALDQALEKLAKLDERQAKIIELRYFGGLSLEETAVAMGTSPATVKRDWALAKAWLFRELQACRQ